MGPGAEDLPDAAGTPGAETAPTAYPGAPPEPPAQPAPPAQPGPPPRAQDGPPSRRHLLRGVGAMAAACVPALVGCDRLTGTVADPEAPVVRWAQFYTTQTGPAAEANRAWMQRIQRIFARENPGWSVELEGYQWDQLDQRIVMDLRANVPHDVTLSSPQLIAMHADASSLLDLTDRIKQWSTAERNEFDWSPVWDSARANGQQLGIPLGVATRGLAYRTRAYERAGIDPADMRTPDDLAAAARKVASQEMAGLGLYLGADRATTEASFAPLVWHYGGDFFDERRGEATLTSDAALEATRWIVEAVYEHGVVPKAAFAATATADDILLNRLLGGSSAQSFGAGNYWVSSLQDAEAVRNCFPPKAGCTPDTIDVRPVPTQGQAQFTNAWLASIAAKTTKPQMSWKLIEVMLRPENLRAYPDAGMPARASEYRTEEYSSDFYQTWARIARTGRGMPKTAYYTQLSDMVTVALQEILGNRADPRDVLARYEDEWNGKYGGL